MRPYGKQVTRTEINNVDNVRRFRAWTPSEEIVGLDIAVYQVLLVDSLHTSEHLFRGHHNRLDGELAPAHVEQVFERRAEQVNYEDIMEAFLPEVVYLWNSDF